WDLRAWCSAVAATGDLKARLRANDEAAGLVAEAHWRGQFLDDAALAARELARSDFPGRVESAWLAAPTLPRLLRWLMVGEPSAPTIRKRAKAALARCSARAAKFRSLLSVLIGDLETPAKLVAGAPGLGWSDDDHPGDVGFAALAWVLGTGPAGSLREAVALTLERSSSSVFDAADDLDVGGDQTREPVRLLTPAI